MQIDSLTFWGIILILLAAVLVAKVALNIRFPAFKLLAGLFLLLVAVKLATGNYSFWPFKTCDGEIFFTSSEIDSEHEIHSRYNLVFSEAVYDLGSLELHGEVQELNIISVFSGSTVYLPPGVPVNIQVEALFASVKMPERYSPVMGSGNFSTADFDPALPHINITVNIVLGSVVFLINDY